MSDPAAIDKLDATLRAMVADPARQDDIVPIVIRLRIKAEGATPAEKMQYFERHTQPVVDRLSALGIEIAERLWIAGSISARAPVSVLGQVAADADVKQLISDHPRKALF
jgi:hypothetical protein